MDGRTGGDGVVRPPLHTPGLAGYLLSWLVSVLAFAILLPLFTGVAPGDYAAGVFVVGYYAALVSVVVAPIGILLVHGLCRNVAPQAVHVLVAALVGFGLVMVFYVREPDTETLAMALALGTSTGVGRLAVVPLVARAKTGSRMADFLDTPGA